MRQHKIWIDATGGSAKPFGVGNDREIKLKICVGNSVNNSQLLSTVKIGLHESEKEISFYMEVDGQTYRMEKFDTKKKEFDGITGRKIDGSIKAQEKRIKESEASFQRTVGSIAAMGSIFCEDKKGANDWKKRMLKAGLDGRGLIMPEDWDQLTEDEKERRLDGAINALTV